MESLPRLIRLSVHFFIPTYAESKSNQVDICNLYIVLQHFYLGLLYIYHVLWALTPHLFG